jgi:ankyrin repeat protein
MEKEDFHREILQTSRFDELSDLRAIINAILLEKQVEEGGESSSSSVKNILYETLVKHALDPYSGNNALHMASANGHEEIVEYLTSLLPNPDFINACNKAGNTALHYASLNGHDRIVGLLLDARADPLISNEAGRIPFEEAILNAHEAVKAILIKKMEEIEKRNSTKGNDSVDNDADNEKLQGDLANLTVDQ